MYLVLTAIWAVFFDFQLVTILTLQITTSVVIKVFAFRTLEANKVILAHMGLILPENT